MSDLPNPEETPQGEYIEAAIHALHAHHPAAALRYLREGLGSERLSILLRQGVRNGS